MKEDKILCPKCGKEMYCPPCEILESGLLWATATCNCGKSLSGYLGGFEGRVFIMGENGERLTK